MEKYRKDKDNNKWTNGKGIYLSCGTHINLKRDDEVVSGIVEYNEMWNGGYYLVLDDNKGSIPMFGAEIEAELI